MGEMIKRLGEGFKIREKPCVGSVNVTLTACITNTYSFRFTNLSTLARGIQYLLCKLELDLFHESNTIAIYTRTVFFFLFTGPQFQQPTFACASLIWGLIVCVC